MLNIQLHLVQATMTALEVLGGPEVLEAALAEQEMQSADVKMHKDSVDMIHNKEKELKSELALIERAQALALNEGSNVDDLEAMKEAIAVAAQAVDDHSGAHSASNAVG